jgi:hypothetical protein
MDDAKNELNAKHAKDARKKDREISSSVLEIPFSPLDVLGGKNLRSAKTIDHRTMIPRANIQTNPASGPKFRPSKKNKNMTNELGFSRANILINEISHRPLRRRATSPSHRSSFNIQHSEFNILPYNRRSHPPC